MRRIAAILIGGLIVWAAIKMFFSEDTAPQVVGHFVPKDDRFAEVTIEKVTPDIFGRYDKNDITLPRDVKPKDIERVIRVYARDADSMIARGDVAAKPIDIIIDKAGRVYVEKKMIDSIKVVTYEKPWIQYEPGAGIGVAYSARGTQPSISASLLHTKGLKWPSVEAGIYGFGIGIQRRITGRLHAGVYAETDYKNLKQRSLKLNLTINL